MVEWKKICQISSNVFAGGTPNTKHKEYYDGEIPWIRSGEIDFNVITSAQRNITQAGLTNSSAKLIRKGSVVMAMTGATVAKTAIVDFETAANQSVCAIETNESIANYRFIYYSLANNYFKIKSSAQGALTSLNLAMIKQIKLPIPSLSEQKRIVDILDTFTASIENLNQQIAERRKQFDHYRNILLNFTGRKDVEWKTLGECFVMKAGKSIKASDISEVKDYDFIYPCFGGNGIRGYVKIINQEGNFPIIGRQGALCGNIQWATGKFYATEHAVVVKPKFDINMRWVNQMLIMMNLNQYKTKSAQPGLSVAKIETIPFPLPPLSEQQRIVSILDTFCNLISKLEEERDLHQKQYEYYREKLLTFE